MCRSFRKESFIIITHESGIIFCPCVPSEENPADTQSRWFELKPGGEGQSEVADPEPEGGTMDLREIGLWP